MSSVWVACGRATSDSRDASAGGGGVPRVCGQGRHHNRPAGNARARSLCCSGTAFATRVPQPDSSPKNGVEAEAVKGIQLAPDGRTAMHGEMLVAEYASPEDASVGLEVLEKEGFTTESVSVVSRQEGSTEEIEDLHDRRGQHSSGEKTTGLGALIGGVVATPIAVTTMIGPFLIAGPLAGMAAGAVVGGLAGNARSWGADETMSERYEKRVANGGVLVIVHDRSARLAEAKRGLKTTNHISLEEFATSSES